MLSAHSEEGRDLLLLWIVVAGLTLSAMVTMATIGHTDKVTPGSSAVTVIIDIILIMLILLSVGVG